MVGGPALASGVVILALSSPALADVAVMPATTSNVSKAKAEAIGILLADAYASESGERTFDPSATGPALKEQGTAGAAAASLRATEYVAVRIVKLDEKYVISATRYAADGSIIHSARISAASLDDAAPATERLARALHDRSSISEAMTLDDVTQEESRRPNRVKTETVAGIKAGVTYAIAKDVRFEPMTTISYDGRHEGNNYFVEWGAGFTIPTNPDGDNEAYGGLHLELGGSYYLTQATTSPYVGAGVLPRILSEGISVAPYLQGGVMFLRQSSTRLYTDVRIAQHVLPMDFGYTLEEDGRRAERNDVYPTEFTLSFGVGW